MLPADLDLYPQTDSDFYQKLENQHDVRYSVPKSCGFPQNR